jgi:hypothetical protein
MSFRAMLRRWFEPLIEDEPMFTVRTTDSNGHSEEWDIRAATREGAVRAAEAQHLMAYPDDADNYRLMSEIVR